MIFFLGVILGVAVSAVAFFIWAFVTFSKAWDHG